MLRARAAATEEVTTDNEPKRERIQSTGAVKVSRYPPTPVDRNERERSSLAPFPRRRSATLPALTPMISAKIPGLARLDRMGWGSHFFRFHPGVCLWVVVAANNLALENIMTGRPSPYFALGPGFILHLPPPHGFFMIRDEYRLANYQWNSFPYK